MLLVLLLWVSKIFQKLSPTVLQERVTPLQSGQGFVTKAETIYLYVKSLLLGFLFSKATPLA